MWTEAHNCGQELSQAQNVEMQLARVHATRESREATASIYDLGGTGVIRAGTIERAYRDLLTLSAQVYLAEPQYEIVGRWLTGPEANQPA
jgi:alkylation response protein AidB-like acyl-CoA dehydrogenase